MDRRQFLKAGLLVITAPAIVRAENIMRVASIAETKMVTEKNISFDEFENQMLRSIAKSFGIPYSMLIGEFKESYIQAATGQNYLYENS